MDLGLELKQHPGPWFGQEGQLALPRDSSAIETYSDASHAVNGGRSSQGIVAAWCPGLGSHPATLCDAQAYLPMVSLPGWTLAGVALSIEEGNWEHFHKVMALGGLQGVEAHGSALEITYEFPDSESPLEPLPGLLRKPLSEVMGLLVRAPA